MAHTPTLITADGATVREGEEVFSHYSMRAGSIKLGSAFEIDGWFFLVYPEGDRDLLNGERICTLTHARRMGWLD